jgi:hypothetical protein
MVISVTDTHLLIAVLCISPLVSFALCAFWRILWLNSRDGDTRRYPRPGTHPFRPESKIKPFKRSPDMVVKVDDE